MSFLDDDNFDFNVTDDTAVTTPTTTTAARGRGRVAGRVALASVQSHVLEDNFMDKDVDAGAETETKKSVTTTQQQSQKQPEQQPEQQLKPQSKEVTSAPVSTLQNTVAAPAFIPSKKSTSKDETVATSTTKKGVKQEKQETKKNVKSETSKQKDNTTKTIAKTPAQDKTTEKSQTDANKNRTAKNKDQQQKEKEAKDESTTVVATTRKGRNTQSRNQGSSSTMSGTMNPSLQDAVLPSVSAECLLCYYPIKIYTVTNCQHSNMLCVKCIMRVKQFSTLRSDKALRVYLRSVATCRINSTLVSKAKAKAKESTNDPNTSDLTLNTDTIINPDSLPSYLTPDSTEPVPIDCHLDINMFHLAHETTVSCPYCVGEPLERLIFSDVPLDYSKVDVSALVYSSELGIYCNSKSTLGYIQHLCALRCQACPSSAPPRIFPTLRELLAHLKDNHDVTYCLACFSSNRFPSERKLYTKDQLLEHYRRGDANASPHPFCKFCKIPVFSDDELLAHMYAYHETCRPCHRRGTKAFFRDNKSLLTHYENSHYICRETFCNVTNPREMSVFSDELELAAHRMELHPTNSSGKAVKASTTGRSANRHQQRTMIQIEDLLPSYGAGTSNSNDQNTNAHQYGARSRRGGGSGHSGGRNTTLGPNTAYAAAMNTNTIDDSIQIFETQSSTSRLSPEEEAIRRKEALKRYGIIDESMPSPVAPSDDNTNDTISSGNASRFPSINEQFPTLSGSTPSSITSTQKSTKKEAPTELFPSLTSSKTTTSSTSTSSTSKSKVADKLKTNIANSNLGTSYVSQQTITELFPTLGDDVYAYTSHSSRPGQGAGSNPNWTNSAIRSKKSTTSVSSSTSASRRMLYDDDDDDYYPPMDESSDDEPVINSRGKSSAELFPSLITPAKGNAKTNAKTKTSSVALPSSIKSKQNKNSTKLIKPVSYDRIQWDSKTPEVITVTAASTKPNIVKPSAVATTGNTNTALFPALEIAAPTVTLQTIDKEYVQLETQKKLTTLPDPVSIADHQQTHALLFAMAEVLIRESLIYEHIISMLSDIASGNISPILRSLSASLSEEEANALLAKVGSPLFIYMIPATLIRHATSKVSTSEVDVRTNLFRRQAATFSRGERGAEAYYDTLQVIFCDVSLPRIIVILRTFIATLPVSSSSRKQLHKLLVQKLADYLSNAEYAKDLTLWSQAIKNGKNLYNLPSIKNMTKPASSASSSTSSSSPNNNNTTVSLPNVHDLVEISSKKDTKKEKKTEKTKSNEKKTENGSEYVDINGEQIAITTGSKNTSKSLQNIKSKEPIEADSSNPFPEIFENDLKKQQAITSGKNEKSGMKTASTISVHNFDELKQNGFFMFQYIHDRRTSVHHLVEKLLRPTPDCIQFIYTLLESTYLALSKSTNDETLSAPSSTRYALANDRCQQIRKFSTSKDITALNAHTLPGLTNVRLSINTNRVLSTITTLFSNSSCNISSVTGKNDNIILSSISSLTTLDLAALYEYLACLYLHITAQEQLEELIEKQNARRALVAPSTLTVVASKKKK